MIYIILGAGIFSLFIGIFSLLMSDFNRKAFSFSFFCVVSSSWIFLNFLLYYWNDGNILKAVYAMGALMPGAVLSWTYTYFEKGNYAWKHVTIYAIGFGIAVSSLFTDKIVKEVVDITAMGVEIKKGSLFPVFSIFAASTSLLAVIRIYSFFRNSTGQKKKQNRLILMGIGLFAGTCVVVSVILPTLGIFSYTNLDSPSAIFFIVFTSIAILKYNFLGIKLFLAQLLSIIIIAIPISEIFYVKSRQELILKVLLSFLTFFIGIFLIITIKKEMGIKEDLQIANAKLRKMDRMKSEFVSIASHQLRTPLTTIKGFLSIINKGIYGKVPEELNEPMQHIETANNRLIVLVEDMMNVSQIEAGKMAFRFKKESINDLMEEILHSFSVMTQEKKLRLELVKDEKISEIWMDYGKIREVVSNIADNAIKYTEKGNIRMETKKTEHNVQIIITDTGIGIEKEGFEFL
ncbi:MAG: HAMP domain-containing sensor histidine kinase, partial [Parcubacteria group bacterium]